MTQTQNPNWFYDQFSKIFTDAASVAQGVRREAEQLFKSQAEKFINDMDLVKREDFDAVRVYHGSKAREPVGDVLAERNWIPALSLTIAALHLHATRGEVQPVVGAELHRELKGNLAI